MKPGRPLAFGRVGKANFIGLPGNPVSSFVTFLIFARPFLLRTQGINPTCSPTRFPRAPISTGPSPISGASFCA